MVYPTETSLMVHWDTESHLTLLRVESEGRIYHHFLFWNCTYHIRRMFLKKFLQFSQRNQSFLIWFTQLKDGFQLFLTCFFGHHGVADAICGAWAIMNAHKGVLEFFLKTELNGLITILRFFFVSFYQCFTWWISIQGERRHQFHTNFCSNYKQRAKKFFVNALLEFTRAL